MLISQTLYYSTGASAHGLAFELQKRGVATTKDGWIRVDPTFESINTPNLFAAGKDALTTEK